MAIENILLAALTLVAFVAILLMHAKTRRNEKQEAVEPLSNDEDLFYW